MMLLARMQPQKHTVDLSYTPFFSIILAAYNEERSLVKCLDSLISLEYPEDKIEIIVGSDGSSDLTNQILNDYSAKYMFIHPLIFDERRGKMQVLNNIVPKARGEYLLFVDADMMLDKLALQYHAQHYTSDEIGGVAGAYVLTSDDGNSGFESEKDYHSIEMTLRRNESAVGSTIGLSGANYSMRASLWNELPSDYIHDDLYSVFKIISQNKRLIYEPLAIAREEYVRSIREEFRRKSRFASRGFATLQYFPELIAPSAGMSSMMILGHKFFRWITPVILICILIITIMGCLSVGTSMFWVLGIAELVVITLVLLGMIMNAKNISLPLVRNLFWFAVMNAAFLTGLFTYLFRKERREWKMSRRSMKEVSEGQH
ncbi:MAG TPA: glycosyltransferase [Candidatus Kapabacteria bacterium]